MQANEEFVQAFAKNKRAMYMAAKRSGANISEISEAMSQTFMNLMQSQDTIMYSDEKKVRGLFKTAVVNRLYNIIRGSSRDDERLKVWVSTHAPASMPLYDTLSVHQALARLSEQDRWLAWRYWALEYSLQEIVEDLKERSVYWSRQYLHKYLRKVVRPALRTALESEGFR